MQGERRIAAYGVCRDDAGRALLVRWPGTGDWTLPGGVVGHGEDPRAAVARAVADTAGLAVAPVALRAVESYLVAEPGATAHVDGIVFDVVPVDARPTAGGAVNADRPAADDPGPAELRWWAESELSGLALDPFARPPLGLDPLPAAALPYPPEPPPVAEARLRAGDRGQRFSAYALTTDPADRVLLTRNAPGYPYAGRWHLPGGGTDFGEQPAVAVLRELWEETGQRGRVTGLLDVGHRHTPRAFGPEGRPLDWHVVRVLYRVLVDEPGPARVLAPGGSTAAARWWSRAAAADLALTPAAAAGLEWWA
ncbi:hypothetical protein GCM10010123_31550 [Pilimelia anulata]|uniref:Nudix hydrolase domain-containing protein n=1 Tax=Pilimelia anulata TaxID=53371 RepID=A0A8J3FCA0_9ACTN|nr:NUDIX hydrolase [Pilimelia anulata]GGJ99368.1 hypothetical protein GCM10010123_31550 [Pilimelia anulata]